MAQEKHQLKVEFSGAAVLDDRSPAAGVDYRRKRQRMRFEDRGIRIPPGFLLVDEAIDEIGSRRFVGKWGHVEGVAALPFYKSETARRSWWYLSYDTTGWRLADEEIPNDHPHTEALAYYEKMFFVAYQMFVDAGERREFNLRYFHPTDGLLKGHILPGILYAQQMMVVLVGRAAIPGSTPHIEPAWLLIEEAGFRQWLNSPQFSRDDEYDAISSSPSPASLQRGTAAVVKLAKELGFPLTRGWLWKIVSTVEPNVPMNRFANEIWKALADVPRQLGPPEHYLRRIRDDATDEAIKQFRAASQRRPPGQP